MKGVSHFDSLACSFGKRRKITGKGYTEHTYGTYRGYTSLALRSLSILHGAQIRQDVD